MLFGSLGVIVQLFPPKLVTPLFHFGAAGRPSTLICCSKPVAPQGKESLEPFAVIQIGS